MVGHAAEEGFEPGTREPHRPRQPKRIPNARAAAPNGPRARAENCRGYGKHFAARKVPADNGRSKNSTGIALPLR